MTEQKTTAYHQLVYLFLFTPTTDVMYFLERSKDFFLAVSAGCSKVSAYLVSEQSNA